MGRIGTHPVLNALEELESNGLATRPWAMAGLFLSLCQRKCGEWTGRGCRDFGERPGQFAAFLADAEQICPKWARWHAENAVGRG